MRCYLFGFLFFFFHFNLLVLEVFSVVVGFPTPPHPKLLLLGCLAWGWRCRRSEHRSRDKSQTAARNRPRRAARSWTRLGGKKCGRTGSALENPPSSLTCAPRGCVAQRGRGGSDGCPPLAGLGKEEAMENAGARGGLGLGVLGGAGGGAEG